MQGAANNRNLDNQGCGAANVGFDRLSQRPPLWGGEGIAFASPVALHAPLFRIGANETMAILRGAPGWR